MNGNESKQEPSLRIPEHIIQESATASHVTGTPRSTGLFDYISRAANSAATILQVIAPAAHATAGSRPPDMQDGSNSKYPQVVQPQNSVEACVFDDGGADSVLDGASVEFGSNRNADRTAKAVTFQDVSRDSVLNERPAAQQRNALEQDRGQEISFDAPRQPAADAPRDVPQGEFQFNAVTTTSAQNPYSKLVELCNQRGRRGRHRSSSAIAAVTTAPYSRVPGLPSSKPSPTSGAGPSSARRNPFTQTTNEIVRAPSKHSTLLNGDDTSLVRFEPAQDPVSLARTLPPSATTTFQPPAGAGGGARARAADLAPQLSMHVDRSAVSAALQPSGGVPSAALPVSKRLSHAPPPASRYALFGPATTKPYAAAPPASATAAATALIEAPSSTRLQASAAAAGWRLPKRDVPVVPDLTSTWVPSRARMLARRRAARVRFKPNASETGATAAFGAPANGAASQEMVVHSGAKRGRDLSPGDVATMHERSATRRRIDASVSVARRSLRTSDQPRIAAEEVLAAVDAIASRKVAAQSARVPTLDLTRAMLATQHNPPELLPGVLGPPGGGTGTGTHAQALGGLGSGLTFPDAFTPLTPSSALIAEEARREKARRAREREPGPSSVSPPSKRHAPGGSQLEPPFLPGPSFGAANSTPAMVGACTSAAAAGGVATGVTDPPTDLDSGLRFPSAQPVAALVGGSAHMHGAGHAAVAPNSSGPVLDLLERKRQEMMRGDGPSMNISEVREKLNAQQAAKQAAADQRKQAARGTPPENPQFNPPASEAQPQPWPAWERAVKEREAAGLPKFSNISQVMNALPDRDTEAASGPAVDALFPSAAAPSGPTPPVATSRPPVPPLFGPGSVSAANTDAPSFGAPTSATPAADAASGADASASKAAGPGATAAEDAAAAPQNNKKKPVVSGWGDAFLKSNAAESAATQKAIQEEVDKAKNPPPASASFGSPVPSSITNGAASFGMPAPTFGTQKPSSKEASKPQESSVSLYPAGGASAAPFTSALSFSFGGQAAASSAAATAPVATPAAAAKPPSFSFVQQDPVPATLGKRRDRDEGDEPSAKRAMPSFAGAAAAAVPASASALSAPQATSALFGAPAASATASAAATAPLFGGAATGVGAGATAGGAISTAGLFGGPSSAATTSEAPPAAAAAASQPLFGAPVSSGAAAASAPLFGAPVVSSGAPTASSAGMGSSGQFTFGAAGPSAASSAALPFGGSSAGAVADASNPGAAKPFKPIVFTPPGSAVAPLATGGATAAASQASGVSQGAAVLAPQPSSGAVATGGHTAPLFGIAPASASLFGSSAPTSPAVAAPSPTFRGTSFGASGFGGAPTGFGATPGAAPASPAVPSFGATTTTGAAAAGTTNPALGSLFAGASAASPGPVTGATLLGGTPATPSGFASTGAPSSLFGATAAGGAASSASAVGQALGGVGGGSALFGAGTTGSMFGAPAAAAPGAAGNAAAPGTGLFGVSAPAGGSMFGASPGSAASPFGAPSSFAATAAPSGFTFGAAGGFGAPAGGASSQPGAAAPAGGGGLFGAPAGGSIGHGGTGSNPFGQPAAGGFGGTGAAPFQFGSIPSVTSGGGAAPAAMGGTPPGTNGIFGAAAPAASGFGAPASPSPFGAPAGASGFGGAASGFGAQPAGAAPFGAVPAPAASPSFGAQPAAPFDAPGGGGAPMFGGAPQPQQPPAQMGAQMGTMFGGNTSSFTMGAAQPTQGRTQGRRTLQVRRRAGRGAGR